MNPDSRLLHLPQSSRYAVSAALYLASVPAEGFHMVGKIAARIGLSPSYLAKILQRLALKGILESRRGAKGGYRLSRPAAEFTLSEIVGASHNMDKGEMACMIEARACDCETPCAMHDFVANAEDLLWRRLDGSTLATFVISPFKSGEKK